MSNNPNRYDTGDVQSAAAKLISSAASIANRHLNNALIRLTFGREIACFAKAIADAAQLGKLPPEEAIQAILIEQRLLLNESTALRMKQWQPELPSPEEVRPSKSLHRLQTSPVVDSDPHRLQRYIGAQQRYITEQSQPRISPPSRPKPIDLRPALNPPLPVEYHDPGFYIVPKSTSAQQLEQDLFTAPTPVVLAKFRSLNPGLDQLKAGHIVVLSDPKNPRCTREEALLMSVAAEVRGKLADLTPEEADFMMRHREEIESFVTQGSTSIGVGEAVFSAHLHSVKKLMLDIEQLHTKTLAKDGHLRSPEFFAERKRLLNKLDSHLTPLTKKGIGFPDHPKLKTALNISSRRLVHRYGRAGGRDQNPGHATHLQGVARAARYIKYGGWVGTALGGGASIMKVQDVCTAGDIEACEKVKYTEAGGFIGGVLGGSAGAIVAGTFVTTGGAISTCAAVGLATTPAGSLICGVVVVGAVSFGIGQGGSKFGEYLGDKIYEAQK